MMFKLKPVILTIVAVVAVAKVVNVISVVVIDFLQHSRNERYVSDNYSGSAGQQALVAYFSRSGNTEIMAMEIARAKNAVTVELVAESYKLDFGAGSTPCGMLDGMKLQSRLAQSICHGIRRFT
ncbi:NADPH-dependent FMN reductase family protein [Agrobacterium tumefaciens]|uniref:hypothetical protein n=1 Tax=Agrobacterium tumefaciens TaxID=358 RepID=UPI00129AB468|nr:hypothetical protein [Agrobacterium tumefaciens]MRH98225.1 hypothetical protein [Agrobacterium tumefaciens]